MKERIRAHLLKWLGAPAPKKERPALRKSLAEVMKHLEGLSFVPETIVDVGFNTGTPGLYEDYPDARYIIVDPLQENEVFMKHQVSRLKHADYVLSAAGAAAGEIEISVTPDFGGSSVYLKSHEAPRRKIPVESLDSMAVRLGASGPFVVKIDVQGAELDVLRGAHEVLKQTEVVIAEARFFPFSGSPEIFEVLRFLDEEGFALYDLFNVARRPSDGALGQIDLVAVRKDGFFRTPSAYRASASYRTDEQRKKNFEEKLRKREEALARLGSTPAASPTT